MFNLEQIKSARVPFDKKQGVYFLFDGDEVVYVGQSVDPVARVHHHASNGKTFDSFSIVYVSEGSMDEVEAYYIWLFAPHYNKGIPKNEHYKTLAEVRSLYYSDYGLSLRHIKKIALKNNIENHSKWYDFKSLDAAIRAHLGITGENNGR